MEHNKLKCIVRAFDSTKDEMFISLLILIGLTVGLSVVFYVVESVVQPDVFRNYFDALVWAYTRYIEGGDGVFDGSPVTVIGKVIASLFGFIGIAIVAIPAGLIGSGFSDAMTEMQKEKEETMCRKHLHRAFKSSVSKNLREYLEARNVELEKEGKAPLPTVYMTHDMQRELAGLRYKRNIPEDLAANVAMKFPEFRLTKNPDDQLTIEHFPVNRSYGCCIERKSKVTIVAPASTNDFGMSYMAYYIAKFGGFNYISKEIVADYNNLTSYFNIHRDGYVNAEGMDSPEDKKGLEHERKNITDYLNDISKVSKGDDHWVIYLLSCPNRNDKTYKADLWLVDTTAKGNVCVHDEEKYKAFFETLSTAMSEFDFIVADGNKRHVLLEEEERVNCGRLLQEQGATFNTFTLRICKNFKFNEKKFVYFYRLAEVINETINQGGHILDKDRKDMSKVRYGYMEQEANKKAN